MIDRTHTGLRCATRQLIRTVRGDLPREGVGCQPIILLVDVRQVEILAVEHGLMGLILEMPIETPDDGVFLLSGR